MINDQLFDEISHKEKEIIYIDEGLEFEHLNSSIIEQNYYQIITNPLVKFTVKERIFEAKRKKEEELLKLRNIFQGENMDAVLYSPGKTTKQTKRNFGSNSNTTNNYDSFFLNNCKQSPISNYKSSLNKKKGFYATNDFLASNRSKMSSDAYDIKELKEMFKKESLKSQNKYIAEDKDEFKNINDSSISLISNAANKDTKEFFACNSNNNNNFILNYSDDSIFYVTNLFKNELFEFDFLVGSHRNNKSDFSSFDEKCDNHFHNKKHSDFKPRLSGMHNNFYKHNNYNNSKNYYPNSNFNFLQTDENALESYRTSFRDELRISSSNKNVDGNVNHPYNISKHRKSNAYSSNSNNNNYNNKFKDNFLSEIRILDPIAEKVQKIEGYENKLSNKNENKKIASNQINSNINYNNNGFYKDANNNNDNNYNILNNYNTNYKDNYDLKYNINNYNINTNPQSNLNKQPIGFYSNYNAEPQKNYLGRNSPNRLCDIAETSKEEKSMVQSVRLALNTRGSHLVEIKGKSITDEFAENEYKAVPVTKNYENEMFKNLIVGNTNTPSSNINNNNNNNSKYLNPSEYMNFNLNKANIDNNALNSVKKSDNNYFLNENAYTDYIRKGSLNIVSSNRAFMNLNNQNLIAENKTNNENIINYKAEDSLFNINPDLNQYFKAHETNIKYADTANENANNNYNDNQKLKSDFKTFYDKDNSLFNTDIKHKLATIDVSDKKTSNDYHNKNFIGNNNYSESKSNLKDLFLNTVSIKEEINPEKFYNFTENKIEKNDIRNNDKKAYLIEELKNQYTDLKNELFNNNNKIDSEINNTNINNKYFEGNKISENNYLYAASITDNYLETKNIKSNNSVFSNNIVSSSQNVFLNKPKIESSQNLYDSSGKENLNFVQTKTQNMLASNALSIEGLMANNNNNYNLNQNLIFSNVNSVVLSTDNFTNLNNNNNNFNNINKHICNHINPYKNFTTSKATSTIQRKDSANSHVTSVAINDSFSSKIKIMEDNCKQEVNNFIDQKYSKIIEIINNASQNRTKEEVVIVQTARNPSIYLTTEENKRKDSNYFCYNNGSLNTITHTDPKGTQRINSNNYYNEVCKSVNTIENNSGAYNIDSKYYFNSENSNNLVSSLNYLGDAKNLCNADSSKRNEFASAAPSTTNYNNEEAIKGFNEVNAQVQTTNFESSKAMNTLKANTVKSTSFPKPPIYTNKYISSTSNNIKESANLMRKSDNLNANNKALLNQYKELSRNLNPVASQENYNLNNYNANKDFKETLSNHSNQVNNNIITVESKIIPTNLFYSGNYSNYNLNNSNNNNNIQNTNIANNNIVEKYQATSNYLNTIPRSSVYNIRGSKCLEIGSNENISQEGISKNKQNLISGNYENPPSFGFLKPSIYIADNVNNVAASQPLNTISHTNKIENSIKKNYENSKMNTIEANNDKVSNRYYLDSLNAYYKEAPAAPGYTSQSATAVSQNYINYSYLTPTINQLIKQEKISTPKATPNFLLNNDCNNYNNIKKQTENCNSFENPNEKANFFQNNINKSEEYISSITNFNKTDFEKKNSIYNQVQKDPLSYNNLNKTPEAEILKIKNQLDSYKQKFTKEINLNAINNNVKMNYLTFKNDTNLVSSSNKSVSTPTQYSALNSNQIYEFNKHFKVQENEKAKADVLQTNNDNHKRYLSSYLNSNYSNPSILNNVYKDSAVYQQGNNFIHKKTSFNSTSDASKEYRENYNYAENLNSNDYFYGKKPKPEMMKTAENNFNNYKYSGNRENSNKNLNDNISNDYNNRQFNYDDGEIFKSQIVSSGKVTYNDLVNEESKKINNYNFNQVPDYSNNNNKYLNYGNSLNQNTSDNQNTISYNNLKPKNNHTDNQNLNYNLNSVSNRIYENNYDQNNEDFLKKNSDKKISNSNSSKIMNQSQIKETGSKKNEYISLNKRVSGNIIKPDECTFSNIKVLSGKLNNFGNQKYYVGNNNDSKHVDPYGNSEFNRYSSIYKK